MNSNSSIAPGTTYTPTPHDNGYYNSSIAPGTTSMYTPHGNGFTTLFYCQVIAMATSLLISIFCFFTLLKAYQTIDDVVRRQDRLLIMIEYFSYTVSKQIFSEDILNPFLEKIGYDYDKLEKDRHEFMKWYVDPKDVSFREPDDLFTPAAADDPNYNTLREVDAIVWKVEKGSRTISEHEGSPQSTQKSSDPTKKHPTPITPSIQKAVKPKESENHE